MDAYEKMLNELAAAGHDMTQAKAAYAKHRANTMTTKAAPPPARKPDPILVTLDLNDVVDVIDAVVQRVEVLEQQVAELQAQKAAGPSKPTLRVAAGRRIA